MSHLWSVFLQGTQHQSYQAVRTGRLSIRQLCKVKRIPGYPRAGLHMQLCPRQKHRGFLPCPARVASRRGSARDMAHFQGRARQAPCYCKETVGPERAYAQLRVTQPVKQVEFMMDLNTTLLSTLHFPELTGARVTRKMRHGLKAASDPPCIPGPPSASLSSL